MTKPQMMKSRLRSATTLLTACWALGVQAQDEGARPEIDPDALAIAHRAVEQLAKVDRYRVTAEVWTDVLLEDGNKLQFTKLVDISLRRPDRLRVDIRTAVPRRSFFYDGASLTFLDQQKGFYGSTEAPDTIDAMLDAVNEAFGVEFPLEDIMISTPFGAAAKAAQSGQYLGLEPVLGVTCHHLAFQAERIDWQVWVEEGPSAVLKKAVITYKEEEGQPQFTAIFSGWDFGTELPDFVFTYSPPDDALKIEFVAVAEEEEASTEGDDGN